MKGYRFVAKITIMYRLFILLVAGVLLLASSVSAQDTTAQLLLLANNLRRNLGLQAYTYNYALAAAAQNHAEWMARSGRIEHVQDNGSRARDRASNAGYPALRISEIIYLGGDSPQDAFNWWLGSAVHYAALTSPNYFHAGIGTAFYGRAHAFVMVFGSLDGDQSGSSAGGQSNGAGASSGPPAYVLGIDEAGNIKHEIQPGQTLGDIALIYGYTWDDIPYMLEINGMTSDDRLLLKPGSVFLVPPQDGTYTPAPTLPAATHTATPAPTLEATKTPDSPTSAPTSAAALTALIRIAPAVTEVAQPASAGAADVNAPRRSNTELVLLAVAILVQLGVLGGALLALHQGSR